MDDIGLFSSIIAGKTHEIRRQTNGALIRQNGALIRQNGALIRQTTLSQTITGRHQTNTALIRQTAHL